MKSKKRKTMIHIFKVILPLAFSVCSLGLSVSLIAGLLHGLFQGLITLSTQKFFNAISQHIFNQGKSVSDIINRLVILSIVIILSYMFNGLHNVLIEDTSYKIMRGMYIKLHSKSERLNSIYFEDANNLDEIEKAKEGAENGTFFLNVLFTVVTYYVPYFIFMTLYMASLRPLLSISVFLIFIPVAVTQFIRVKLYTSLTNQSATYNRKYKEYEECIKGRKYFKETRMLGAYGYFSKLYQRNIKLHNQEKWKTTKKAGLAELGMKGITLVGYVIVLLLFVEALLKNDITIGAFVALFTSINTMFRTMEELICGHIGILSRNMGSVRNYVNFLEGTQKEGTMNLITKGAVTIQLDHVSFRYPHAKYNVLENINLQIASGEKVAIVGENGAGKSTLAKVITGIYTPTEGMVCRDGVDTNLIKGESLLSNVSAVFQNYQKYAISMRDNVYIADVTSGSSNLDIEKRLKESDIDVKSRKYPKGIETILSREFGGVELSGGEWQKIAIARGLYKSSNIIILDEPTAAIDPFEETRIYHTFSKMAEGKTALIITHRLAAARIADRIIVLDKGQIIENGTHEELLQQKGTYSKMFCVQKGMYQ